MKGQSTDPVNNIIQHNMITHNMFTTQDSGRAAPAGHRRPREPPRGTRSPGRASYNMIHRVSGLPFHLTALSQNQLNPLNLI